MESGWQVLRQRKPADLAVRIFAPLCICSRIGSKQRKVEVIGIDSQGPIPHPYTLDNAVNKGGWLDLTMKWDGNSLTRDIYSATKCSR